MIMEIKRNDATVNRPEGSRVIDAPYVFIDIPAYTEQLREEKSWVKGDRNSITVFKSEETTIVVTALKAGAQITNNANEVFYTVLVLQGEVVVTTDDVERDVLRGQAVAFHPNVLHSIRAISDTNLLLTSYCKNTSSKI
jgi:quercetin dioxygenase-like cupin family protein